MAIYSIYEGHMFELRKKVSTIQKKCEKFGCEFRFEEIGEEMKRVNTHEKDPLTGKEIFTWCKFITVEAEGTAIINDWEFVASVEHTEAGNIYSKALSDVEIPEKYRNTDSCLCEHCKTDRMRKDTFIIRNTKTNDFKQVGKSCLRDFTFGMSASTASYMASLKEVFEEYEERPCGGYSWSQRYVDTKEVLQFAAETIRHFGYSKSEHHGESTRDLTENFFDLTHGYTRYWDDDFTQEVMNKMKKAGFNHESKEANEMVEKALVWLNAQEVRNDYLNNLFVACNNESSHYGRFGLLVSLFPTFNRELEQEAQRKEEQAKGMMSEHIGQIGDRISFVIADYKCITSWESNFGYYPTTTYVWKIVDEKGNVFTWKTSNGLNDEDIGKTIRGTVKEHKTFREVKQTELTRCKVQG